MFSPKITIYNLVLQIIVISLISFFLMEFVDRDLTLYLHNREPGWLVGIFNYITFIGDGLFTCVFIFMSLVYIKISNIDAKKNNDNIAFITKLILSFLLMSFIVWPLKLSIGRLRPEDLVTYNNYGFQFFSMIIKSHSFPSGHSATAFVLFLNLAFFAPKYTRICVMLAFVCAISRIVVFKHFLSDIIVGSYIGYISVAIVYQTKLLSHYENNLANKIKIMMKVK